MKKLSFIMAVAMLLCVSKMQAKNEKISFQVQAGLNLSQITSPDADLESMDLDGVASYKDGVKPGFNLGFRFDYQFNDYVAVQTGLSYTMKGEKIKMSDEEGPEIGERKTKTTIHYWEIPILAGARYSINDNIQLQFNTGPYIALGIAGKSKTKDVYSDTEDNSTDTDKYWCNVFGDPEKDEAKLKDDEDPAMGCKRFDMGWKFELGVDIKNYYVGLAYDLGFVDITNSKAKKEAKEFGDNYEPMKNRNFSINVGYRF